MNSVQHDICLHQKQYLSVGGGAPKAELGPPCQTYAQALGGFAYQEYVVEEMDRENWTAIHREAESVQGAGQAPTAGKQISREPFRVEDR